MKIRIIVNDNIRQTWEAIERASIEVAKWPAWKLGAFNCALLTAAACGAGCGP